MKFSIPLFNEILKNNILIKGRLNIKNSELEKLYKSLVSDEKSLQKKLSNYEKKIKNQIAEKNQIKLERKRKIETLKKTFSPETNKISLLYKKQSDLYYIKARFYWQGKQREVQVGSIPIVIEIINSMIKNGIILNINIINDKELSWGQINKNNKIIDAIKKIASLKAQEYIIRKLLDLNNYEDEAYSINLKNKFEEKKIDAKISKNLKKEENNNENLDGIKWYEKWRKDNL